MENIKEINTEEEWDEIMYAEIQEEGTEEKAPWEIKDDGSAEWLIDRVAEELKEINRYEEALKDKVALLQDKLNKAKREKENKIARRDYYLQRYFDTLAEELKKTTKTQQKYRLPSGEIIKKYPGPKYERNEEELTAWLKANQMDDLIETKETAKWAELKKQTQLSGTTLVYKETGEVITGVEIIERPPTIEFKED